MASQKCLHDRFATVPCHMAGMWSGKVREIDRICGRRTYSKYHSGLLVYPVVQPSQYRDACKVNGYLNLPYYTMLRVAFYFEHEYIF